MNICSAITWNPQYEIGISSIDCEHRLLFRAYNTFVRASAVGDGAVAIKYALSVLENYTIYHFKNEEDLMRQMGYGKIRSHMAEHKKFIRFICKVKNMDLSGSVLRNSFCDQFKDWLIRHVMEKDLDIGVSLRSNDRFAATEGELVKGDSDDNRSRPMLAGARTGARKNSRLSILETDGRVFERHSVSLRCLVTNAKGQQRYATIRDFSMGGARLDRTTGFVREMSGVLHLPATSLPGLPFVVKDVRGHQIRVSFVLSPLMQTALANALKSPTIRTVLLGNPGGEPVDGVGTAELGDEMASGFDSASLGAEL